MKLKGKTLSIRRSMMTKNNVTPEKLNSMIAEKAFEVFVKRGNKPGDSLSDWVTAERQVKKELGL